MSRDHAGRHELGQNFLHDPRVIAHVVGLAASTKGPLVEWGTGDGALTLPLARLGRPLLGVEVDARRAKALDRRTGPHVCIQEGDILRHAPPSDATVVGNIPFHLTTPVLRHLLASSGWAHAVLVTQWEVARKRAGVGGTTQLTAQWWPWYEFRLDRRIPATAFRPRPSVDAGILLLDRRVEPLLPPTVRRAYQSWVRRIFQGPGRGLADVLARSGVPRPALQRFCREQGLRDGALPRDLTAAQWAEAFLLAPRPELRRRRGTGRTPAPRRRRP